MSRGPDARPGPRGGRRRRPHGAAPPLGAPARRSASPPGCWARRWWAWPSWPGAPPPPTTAWRRRPTWRTQRRRCSASRLSPTRSGPCRGSPTRRSPPCSSGASTVPGVTYLALRSAPADTLGDPALVAGRGPDPVVPDEVVLLDSLAGALDMSVGSTLELCLLTSEEFASFDTGFGDARRTVPDAAGGRDRAPRRHRHLHRHLRRSCLRRPLRRRHPGRHHRRSEAHRREGRLPAVAAAVAELAAANPIGEGAEEFPSVALSTPDERRDAAATTAQVLVGGLLACAAVAALVGLLLIGQALGRHFEADAADQQIEAALGMTPTERCLARVLPASVTAAIAAASPSAARWWPALKPLGPLARPVAVLGRGPEPRRRPGRGPRRRRRRPGARRARRLAGRPAHHHHRSRRPLSPGAHPADPRRRRDHQRRCLARPRPGPGPAPPGAGHLATVVVGVAGVTAALTFAASLTASATNRPAGLHLTSSSSTPGPRRSPRSQRPPGGCSLGSTRSRAASTGDRPPSTPSRRAAWPDPGGPLLAGRPAVVPTRSSSAPKPADSLGVAWREGRARRRRGGDQAPRGRRGGVGSTMGQEGFGNGVPRDPPTRWGAEGHRPVRRAAARLAPRGGRGRARVRPRRRQRALDHPPRPHCAGRPRPRPDPRPVGRLPCLRGPGGAGESASPSSCAAAPANLAPSRGHRAHPRQVVARVLSAAAPIAAIGLVVGVPWAWASVVCSGGRRDRVGLRSDVLVPAAEVVLVVVGRPRRRRGCVGRAGLRAVLRPGVRLRAE